MKIINHHRQPITLDSGLILAAAGTAGSVREVESITERDRRRYVTNGRIAVIESAAPAETVQPVVEEATPVASPSTASEADSPPAPTRRSGTARKEADK